jgi:hypothetical protein
MNTPCEKTEIINYIKERVDRIDIKTDLLLADRNKMKGLILGVTGAITIIFNLVILIFKK